MHTVRSYSWNTAPNLTLMISRNARYNIQIYIVLHTQCTNLCHIELRWESQLFVERKISHEKMSSDHKFEILFELCSKCDWSQKWWLENLKTYKVKYSYTLNTIQKITKFRCFLWYMQILIQFKSNCHDFTIIPILKCILPIITLKLRFNMYNYWKCHFMDLI